MRRALAGLRTASGHLVRAVGVLAVALAPAFLLYVFAKRSESWLFVAYFGAYLLAGYYLVYRVVSIRL